MPNPADRERASNILEDALITTGLDREQWVNDLRFSPNSEEIVRSLLRKRINSITSALGWGSPAWPKIPHESLVSVVVDALGGNLLDSSLVRNLIGLWIVEKRPESAFHSLKKYLGNCETKDVPNRLAEVQFRFSTSLATELCSISGLPLIFSIRGNRDERAPHGIIQPIRYPPPLADFQQVVKESLTEALQRDAGRALVVMPTGSGKTRTTIDSVLHWLEENSRDQYSVLWIADRDELCDQAIETFQQLAPSIISDEVEYWRYWRGQYAEVRESDCGLIVPGITVTTVQQLRSRLSNHEPAAKALLENSDVIIIDEAHRNLDWIEDLGRELEEGGRGTRMIGLTATPFRSLVSETGRLSLLFNQRVCVPIPGAELNPQEMVSSLTEKGILAERVNLDPRELYVEDEEGIREIQIIRNLIKRGSKSIIVFTNDVDEARTLSSIMRLSEGFHGGAEHIEASTPYSTRRNIVRSFRNGEINVLFNFGILTTGFDAPGIDSVVIFRRSLDTESSLFSQMIGRGLRGPLFGGTKNCKITHYRGN